MTFSDSLLFVAIIIPISIGLCFLFWAFIVVWYALFLTLFTGQSDYPDKLIMAITAILFSSVVLVVISFVLKLFKL